MVSKDDVMELHSTIVAMKSKQENMRKLSMTLQKEAEEMDGLIEVLEKDYQALKAKAES